MKGICSAMARINVEECWWSDPRRAKLGQLLGNPYMAESVVVHAWRLAQKYWEKGELIPGHVYITLYGAYELLRANLASLHESGDPQSTIIRTPVEHISNTSEQGSNGVRTHLNIIEQASIYLRGSREYLSWGTREHQKRVAAGLKSAEKRRLLYGTAQPMSNTSRTHSNTLELSGSVSGSGSGSRSSSRSGSKKKDIVGIRLDYPHEFDEIWNLYGRRGDKKKAYQEYQRLGLQEGEHGLLVQAVNRYIAETSELQYRKHFDGFLKTDWRECLKGSPPRGIHPKTQERLDVYDQWKSAQENEANQQGGLLEP